jgi:riboflavin transporter FmnP
LIDSDTAGAGELSNFLIGLALVLPAGFLYRRRKSIKSALWSCILGLVCMTAASIPVNYYISFPVYFAMGWDKNAVIGAFHAIYSSIDSVFKAVIMVNAPFTFVKGFLCVLITFPLYKRISRFIHGN